MGRFNYDVKKNLREDEAAPALAPGGAYYASGSGVSAPYQTPFNTVGIGNPVPAGTPNSNQAGSGDRFDNVFGMSKKKAAPKKKK